VKRRSGSGYVGLFSYAQVGVEFDDVVVTGAEVSAADSFSEEAGEAESSTDPGWDLPEYGEILIDVPTGWWEGVVAEEAI